MQGKASSFRQVLLDRIRSGEYPVGCRLPGMRTIAAEFSIHPNTVAKVYAELSDHGVVKTVHGSGTYVLEIPEDRLGALAGTELLESLKGLALQSRRLGLDHSAWSDLVARAEAEIFGESGKRIWFVECNQRDTEDLATNLSALLDANVIPLLTDRLSASGLPDSSPEDLVVTTPFHREEVELAVSGQCRVLDLTIVPSPETLVAIARMPAGLPYSVIASNRPTLERFARLLEHYTRREAAEAVLISDPDAPRVIRSAKVLIDSHSIHEQVLSHDPDAFVVTLRYQIEPASVAFLREVLRTPRRQQGPLSLPV